MTSAQVRQQRFGRSAALAIAAIFILAACSGGSSSKAGNSPDPGVTPRLAPIPQKLMVADNGKSGMELYQGGDAGIALIKDINVNTSSDPYSLTLVNGITYFSATDGISGRELWRSDGFSGGTRRVKDIRPGAAGSFSTYSEFHAVNGVLYFVADDGVHGRELWRSDGTESGTRMVKDINPGPGDAFGEWYEAPAKNAIGNVIYFQATTESHGRELWKSDGTEAGTVLVKDIVPGRGSPWLSDLTIAGSLLYFSVYTNEQGREPWVSNGTANGTFLLQDIFSGANDSDPAGFVLAGGSVFFTATAEATGREMWKTDGTTNGTVLVKDINSGAPSSDFTSMEGYGWAAQVIGSTIYFFATDGTGGELWMSDGSAEGTVIVKDIRATGSSLGWGARLHRAGNTLYFIADDGTTGFEYWKSDGTANGTQLLKDIGPGIESGDVWGFWYVNGKIFFTSYQPSIGNELWISDGTESGTLRITDTTGVADTYVSQIVAMGGETYFAATSVNNNAELWKTNGTLSGTIRVKDLNPASSWDGIGFMVAISNRIFFAGYDGVNGSELWSSDGTESGTTLLADINTTATDGSDPDEFNTVNGVTYFTATSGTYYERRLWRTNGTADGTYPIATLRDFGSDYDQELPTFGNVFIFSASHPDTGREMWRSDGTAEGTYLLKDINPGGAEGLNYLFNHAVIGSTVFFVAEDPDHGVELWKTDGTTTGTVLVKDINTGMEGNYPASGIDRYVEFFVMGSAVFFIANDGVNGNELWTSDGTESGTKILKELVPGVQDGVSRYCGARCIRVAEGRIYIQSNDTLWISDGTEVGTTRLRDQVPASGLLDEGLIATPTGSKVFFLGSSSEHGTELWKTDGTADGTKRLTDAAPGSESLMFDEYTVSGSKLYFAVFEQNVGDVLWVSDGTETGTRRLKMLVEPRYSRSSAITQMNMIESSNYMLIDAGGYELWKTDGTENGTVKISGDVNANRIAVAGDRVYYVESVYNEETDTGTYKIRVSDGTEAGTTTLYELTSSDDGIDINFISLVGEFVYYTFDDGIHGEELWATDGTVAGTQMVIDFNPGADTGMQGYRQPWLTLFASD